MSRLMRGRVRWLFGATMLLGALMGSSRAMADVDSVFDPDDEYRASFARGAAITGENGTILGYRCSGECKKGSACCATANF